MRTSRAWCQEHHCSSLPIIPWTGHVCLQVRYDVISFKIVEESSHVSELRPWQHFLRAEEVVALARLANCLLASKFLLSAVLPKCNSYRQMAKQTTLHQRRNTTCGLASHSGSSSLLSISSSSSASSRSTSSIRSSPPLPSTTWPACQVPSSPSLTTPATASSLAATSSRRWHLSRPIVSLDGASSLYVKV